MNDSKPLQSLPTITEVPKGEPSIEYALELSRHIHSLHQEIHAANEKLKSAI